MYDRLDASALGFEPRVLVTGCSDGSLGSHLAIAFYNADWRVFATAGNTTKLNAVTSAGVERIQLDTLSQSQL
jgi:1-acylglycerone phosphate reductase